MCEHVFSSANATHSRPLHSPIRKGLEAHSGVPLEQGDCSTLSLVFLSNCYFQTTIQVGNHFSSDLEGFNLSTIPAQAPERTPLSPDPPGEDKKDSSELLLDVADGKQDRSFTIGDVPPMSATSRSHLIDLQSHTFSIPGSSSGSTLRLYS